MPPTLGLVLSGGGARALGHVGVLRALEESGLEAQVISGTSAGAIVAALHAAGYSAEAMLDFFVRKSPFRLSKLSSLTKPGIFDTAKVVGDFLEYFPDDSFEALRKRIFVTATDLAEARLEIFSSGRLIPAILASASLPLVFTPTAVEGRWYSDGGITDNFPVEPLVGHCDVILGVYVSPMQRVEPRDLRSSLAVSHRAFDIAMWHASKRKFHQCDLVICPQDLAGFGTFGSAHFGEIMEIGYQAAREQVAQIERLTEQAPDTGP